MKIKKEINAFLQDSYEEGIISLEEKLAMTNDNPRIPILYTITKIHKHIKKPPGRPIVSGVHSVFQILVIYVDSYLQDEVKRLPRCLKDTRDFLDRI